MNFASSNTNRQQIGVFFLTMIAIGAIVTVRTLPEIAIYGIQAIFFVLFVAILYMIPISIVSFELSVRYPIGGGMYTWVKSTLGKKFGFFEAYTELICNIILMPLIVTFISSSLLYVISPILSDNILLVYILGLVIFFCVTFINLKGLKTSAFVSSICAILGVFIPMILIIIIGIHKVIFHPETILLNFNFSNMIPSFNNLSPWTAINSVVLSFAGIEVITVHVRNVVNVKKSYTVALTCLTIITSILYIIAPLSIAMIIPVDQIKLAIGVPQLLNIFFTEIGIGFLAPIIIILACIGALGALNAWVISTIKPLLVASEDGLCHKIFATVNKNGAPVILLICQGCLMTVLLTFMQFSPTISDFYWIFTVLCCQNTVVLYIFCFVAYFITLFIFNDNRLKIFKFIICITGVFICIIAIIVGFIPSPSISLASHPLRYAMLIISGLVISWLPAIPLYLSGNRK